MKKSSVCFLLALSALLQASEVMDFEKDSKAWYVRTYVS